MMTRLFTLIAQLTYFFGVLFTLIDNFICNHFSNGWLLPQTGCHCLVWLWNQFRDFHSSYSFCKWVLFTFMFCTPPPVHHLASLLDSDAILLASYQCLYLLLETFLFWSIRLYHWSIIIHDRMSFFHRTYWSTRHVTITIASLYNWH